MHYLQVGRFLIRINYAGAAAPLRRLCPVSPSPCFALGADPLVTTYRIRKVKCDEVKPSCKRCTDTGRKCDGYTPPPTSGVPKKTSLVVRSSKQAPRQPDVHADVVLSSTFGTPEEYLSLDFFLQRTAPAISGAFDTGFVSVSC
jgi:hypothetical protein